MNDPVKHVTPSELKSKLQSNQDFLLIDVREPNEHDQYNIGGKLIPLGEVMENVSQIPKNKEVVIYCKMGIRSQIAIQRLQDKFGFTNLINLKGGIEAWKKLKIDL